MKINEINNTWTLTENLKLKIGFDVHGVIDTYPQIVRLLNTLYRRDSVEIHIITGQRYDVVIKDLLSRLDIRPDAYFSIVEYLENKGIPVEWKDGLPFSDKDEWNKAKKEYCSAVGIDILFDDSPVYQSYFNDGKTLFCLVNNPNRRIYETRAQ